MSDSFEITYAAHTTTCTFLLDAEGVCRRIAVGTTSKRNLQPTKAGRDATRLASRCVGAQYVASLDPTVSGMLAEMPRVGAAMLFARVDERGRVTLVRTGVVTRFESHREDPFQEPFQESDKAPSMSVETSAPVLPPSVPTSRRPRETSLPPRDPYHDESSDRTQRIEALRPQNFRSLRGHEDDATLHQSPAVPTLRQPIPVANDDDHDGYDAYAVRARPLPPRPTPPPPRMRSERVARPTDPDHTPRAAANYPPIERVERVAARRRG